MVDQEDLSKIGEVLWDFLTDEAPEQQDAEAAKLAPTEVDENAQAAEELELLRESLLAIHEAGVDNVSSEDLQQAIEQMSQSMTCLLYTSPSPRDRQKSRMPSSA